MPPVSSILKYTTLAATTTRDIAGSGQVPFLASVAALSLSIVGSVQVRRVSLNSHFTLLITYFRTQSLKSNKDECLRMVEHIHEILCAIVKLYSQSQMDGMLPPALLYDIGQFARCACGPCLSWLIYFKLLCDSTLQKIYTFVDTQLGMGKLKRLLKQADINLELNSCKSELKTALDTFRVRSSCQMYRNPTDIER